MGFWGTGLYDNDIALDAKDECIELLNDDPNGLKIVSTMIARNYQVISDEYEAPVFWLALADTLWDFGFLDENVKNKAISYIDKAEKEKRFLGATAEIEIQVLQDLKKKLTSENSSVKKLKKTRQFRCEWEIGDTYAFPLTSDYAIEKKVYGEYLIFHKVGETIFYPSHIIPIMLVKITSGGKLPNNVEEFNKMEYIQTGVTKYEERFFPFHGLSSIEEQIAEKMKIEYKRDEYGHLPHYRIALICTSKKDIPNSLIYLGNFKNVALPQNEHIPPAISITSCFWKQQEKMVIDLYYALNRRQSPLYSDSSI